MPCAVPINDSTSRLLILGVSEQTANAEIGDPIPFPARSEAGILNLKLEIRQLTTTTEG